MTCSTAWRPATPCCQLFAKADGTAASAVASPLLGASACRWECGGMTPNPGKCLPTSPGSGGLLPEHAPRRPVGADSRRGGGAERVTASTGRSPTGTWWSPTARDPASPGNAGFYGEVPGGDLVGDVQVWVGCGPLAASTGRSPAGTWWVERVAREDHVVVEASTGRSPAGTWWRRTSHWRSEMLPPLLRGGPQRGPGGSLSAAARDRSRSCFYGEVPSGDLVVR